MNGNSVMDERGKEREKREGGNAKRNKPKINEQIKQKKDKTLIKYAASSEQYL